MATMQSTAAGSADLKRHRLCLPGLEGDFCSDMQDPAGTHLLWGRFLKPGHLINLSLSLLDAFPEG